jgi:hypothetical protein
MVPILLTFNVAKMRKQIFILLVLGILNLQGFSQDSKIDFSAVDLFWPIVDKLKQDSNPSEEEWNKILATPFYKHYAYSSDKIRNGIKEFIKTAFMPGRKNRLDSILNGPDNDYRKAMYLHVINAVKEKPELQLYQKKLLKSKFVDSLATIAQLYLPKGTIKRINNPKVTFGFYQPDANGGINGITLDLKFTKDYHDFTLMVAHEMHHYYVENIRRKMAVISNDSAYGLINAFIQLQFEGIADQIDKESLLAVDGKGIPPFLYNLFRSNYENPAQNLVKVDSLLKVIYHNPETVKSNGELIRELLPLGSHPHGYYMSQIIKSVYGTRELISTVYNPFDFIRLYNKAARKKGLFSFSKEAIAYLDKLEKTVMQ